MNQLELNRERRTAKGAGTIGNEQPAMPLLWLRQSLGFRASPHRGRSIRSKRQVPVCRNCHRILSDWQKDHPACVGDPPNDLERIGHALLGLADMFELLVKWLREHATKLVAAATQTSHHTKD